MSIYKHVLLHSTSQKYMKLTFNNQIRILSNKYNYLRCYFYPKRLVVVTFKQDVNRFTIWKIHVSMSALFTNQIFTEEGQMTPPSL